MDRITARTTSPSGAGLSSLRKLLIEPSPLITAPGEQRRARLLAGLLIALMGVYAISLLFGADFWSRIAVIVLLIAAYGLSRTRTFLPAALIMLFALLIPSFADVARLTEFSVEAVTIPLLWIVTVVILGGLLLPPRWFVMLGAAILIGLVLLVLLLPGLHPLMLGPVSGVLVAAFALMIVGAGLMQTDVKDVTAKVPEMEFYSEAMLRTYEAVDVARQQALDADRVKGEFLATMSHELRTPLNAILGFAEIMMGGMGGKIDPDAMHMVQRIHANSTRLLDLINDVLAFTRVEAERIEVKQEPFSPRDLATNVRREMRLFSEQKGLDFDLIIDDDLPHSLVGDEMHVRHIMTNLLSNAIKFTEVGRICMELNRVDTDWEIVVSDSGVGIAPDVLEFIFEPFRQGDSGMTRTYGGSGLGLAIVHKLTLLMEGRVSVRSTQGQGSTFNVTLPIKLG